MLIKSVFAMVIKWVQTMFTLVGNPSSECQAGEMETFHPNNGEEYRPSK